MGVRIGAEVQINNLRGVTVRFTGMSSWAKRLAFAVSRDAARRMASNTRYFVRELPRKRNNPPGHSTPQRLEACIKAPRVLKKGLNGTWVFKMEGTDRSSSSGLLNPLWVEFGTSKHPIPVRQFGRNKIVTHPGAQPTWFFRHALDKTEAEMDGIVANAVKRAKQEWAGAGKQ